MARYGTKRGVREILLTFDDGPHPRNTSKLLDVLAAYGEKAMFFVVGSNLEDPKRREIMRRAHREGHQIGNHTFSHHDLKTLDEAKIRDELRRTQDLIAECSHELRFFRPPYGSTNAVADRVLVEEGYTKIMWNVDSLDWHRDYKKDGAWVDHAMAQIKAREDSIFLAHDIHATTVNHVEALVKQIKRLQGVEFVLYA